MKKNKLAQKSHQTSQAELKSLQLELNPSQIRAEISSDASLMFIGFSKFSTPYVYLNPYIY